MSTEKDNPAGKQDKQHNTQSDNPDEQVFNPFDKKQNTSSNKEALQEEANAEQQRKEALTERD